MCGSKQAAPAPVVPATPPPPPPVLEQPAPDSAAPKVAEEQKNRALGTKQYRTSLSIGNTASVNNNTELGINA